jgi:hypothetical protein
MLSDEMLHAAKHTAHPPCGLSPDEGVRLAVTSTIAVNSRVSILDD